MGKRIVLLLVAAILVLTAGLAGAASLPPQAGGAPPAAATVPADVATHPECDNCGMNRGKFSHSRVLITYADGTTVGTCSINCAAAMLAERQGQAVTSVQVGDYNDGTLLAAERALWVIGGDRRGVMTATPKWAFADQAAAAAFIARHGGRPASYQEVLRAATDEL
ncbi:hypothetical protein GURASL_13080 [Geotalea uraniireducens]|uniref:NosL family protein n=1 Tax=Geotalea uraniireducens TaxID=351604 RepID=A0ABN6VQ49_9BACT|nr:nitrous oxide reductase accessory protein NosL [Geotalea uraniireducens]BDV42385.1 hypothetical protein GURASL_13080 [Geotalea uraniireducens]